MPYDELLAARIRALLRGRAGVTEMRQFGCLGFHVGGHMVCVVDRLRLMVRVGPERHAVALRLEHVAPMDFAGRPAKGMVYVLPEGTTRDDQLAEWLQLALDFVQSLPRKKAATRRPAARRPRSRDRA